MRKYVLGSILALLLAVPLTALGDTGGSADATLNILSVINTVVTGAWDALDLEQDDIDLYAGGGGGLMSFTGTLTVTVEAITDWQVHASYSASLNGAAHSSGIFAVPNSTLQLSGGAFTDFIKYYNVDPITPEHGLNPLTDLGPLTDIGFTGGNNIATGGNSRGFTLAWDPAQLDGDFDVGDTIVFTVFFVVTESDL